MYQHVIKTGLVGVIALVLGGYLLTALPAQAALVTDQALEDQKEIVLNDAKTTVQSYFRLLLYHIIDRLEDRGAVAPA